MHATYIGLHKYMNEWMNEWTGLLEEEHYDHAATWVAKWTGETQVKTRCMMLRVILGSLTPI